MEPDLAAIFLLPTAYTIAQFLCSMVLLKKCQKILAKLLVMKENVTVVKLRKKTVLYRLQGSLMIPPRFVLLTRIKPRNHD